MTTSHRVDGLAFLNDDVVGEYKRSGTPACGWPRPA